MIENKFDVLMQAEFLFTELELTPEQRRFITDLIMKDDKFMLLSGAPGSGKTFIIANMISLLAKAGLSINVLAPTGRAVVNLRDASGVSTSIFKPRTWFGTIHKALASQDHLDPADFTFVDESSMIPSKLMQDFLAFIPSKRVIFIGDQNQLPPIEQGYPFRDMWRSKQLPNYYFGEVFRQAKGSAIKECANLLMQGSDPIHHLVGNDLQLIQATEEEAVEYMLKNYHANTKIVTPMRKGLVGTHNLNITLQEKLLNSRGRATPYKFGPKTFYYGDLVICKRNMPDYRLVNGDVGHFYASGNEFKVGLVTVSPKYITENVELAYASTVHSMQGLDAKTVIIPLSAAHSFMWNLPLLYTALTRAREKCILIGDLTLLPQIRRKKKGYNRHTRLYEYLRNARKV